MGEEVHIGLGQERKQAEPCVESIARAGVLSFTLRDGAGSERVFRLVLGLQDFHVVFLFCLSSGNLA
jgi:hypothetical protein